MSKITSSVGGDEGERALSHPAHTSVTCYDLFRKVISQYLFKYNITYTPYMPRKLLHRPLGYMCEDAHCIVACVTGKLEVICFPSTGGTDGKMGQHRAADTRDASHG